MKVADVGGVIRGYRKASGISQKDLAAMVGVSRATLNYVESGRDIEIGATRLLALLEVLGVPLLVPTGVDRAHDDEVLEGAAKAAATGKVKLARKHLVEALATGRVPEGYEVGVRTVLDHATRGEALAMVRAVAAGTGQQPKAVWRNARSVAGALGSGNRAWRLADA